MSPNPNPQRKSNRNNNRNLNNLQHHSSSSHSSTIRTNSTTCTAMSVSMSNNNTNTNNSTTNQHHNYSSIIYAGGGTTTPGATSDNHDFKDSQELSHSSNQQHLQYLPICDALFNLICLSTYFCDVTFNLLLAWSIYTQKNGGDGGGEIGDEFDPNAAVSSTTIYPYIAFCCIFASLLTTQILSLQWYYSGTNTNSNGDGTVPVTPIVLILHFCQFGILYRYFKLFTPLDLRHIKSEVRNLIILRLLHGFLQSLPLLICQLVNWLQWVPGTGTTGIGAGQSLDDLALIATLFSLFSIAWALSSYTKNIQRTHVHKLVLTWLGVLCQFGWRLGTIGSRTLTFALYTCIYKEWILIVVCLHWGSMLLWLILVDSSASSDRSTAATAPVRATACQARVQSVNFRKLAVVSFIYTFCYVNVDNDNGNGRSKSSIYYATMFLENSLLLGVSWIGMEQQLQASGITGTTAAAADLATNLPIMVLYKEWIAGIIIGGFWIGMAFMGIYYQYCHVRKLSIGAASGGANPAGHGHLPQMSGDLENLGNHKPFNISSLAPGQVMLTSTPRLTYEHELGHGQPLAMANCLSSSIQAQGDGAAAAPIGPGVFNCRFNPALMKRKKKKPSTFVPPIPVSASPMAMAMAMSMAPAAPNSESPGPGAGAGKMSQAFWKKPLPVMPSLATTQHMHEGPYGYTSPDADTLKIAEWRQRSVAAAATASSNPAEYYEVNSDLDDYSAAYAAPRPRNTLRSARSRKSRSRAGGHSHGSHHHHKSTNSAPRRHGPGPGALRHCNSESDLESAFGHLGRFTFAPGPPMGAGVGVPQSHCCTNSDDGDVDSGDGEVETEAEAELDALYSRITAAPGANLPQQNHSQLQRPKPAPRKSLPQPETSL